MKLKSLIIALLAVVLIIPAAANSATLNFDYENGNLDSAAGEFTFDILLGNVTMTNVDAWNLAFTINRDNRTDVPFSFKIDDSVYTDSNYALSGSDGSEYQIVLTPSSGDYSSFEFFGGDTNASGYADQWRPGGVIARITLDNVQYCDWFNIELEPGNSFLLDDTMMNMESFDYVAGTTAYKVHVTPIPSALFLMLTGLMGIAGIRRRK